MKLIALALSAVLALSSAPLLASEPVAESSVNTHRNIGIYASLLGDSTLPIISLNLAYEPLEELRLTGGFGISLGYTFGVGAKYLFTDWAVRPFLGANLGFVYTDFVNAFADGIGDILSGTTRTTPSKSELYAFFGPSFGFDWKTPGGFNLGLGGNIWMHSSSGLITNIVPFLNIGFYF